MSEKILFLGIGGIGVSALAVAARRLGSVVEGYDSKPNNLTSELSKLGVPIYSRVDNIDVAEFDMVVYSSAITQSNPLLVKAKQFKILCLQRAMFLSVLMKKFSHSMAITGTHGKTTTSSVLAMLLKQLDSFSSFVVGGIVKNANTNVEINGTDKLVLEADESDASFMYLNPCSAIVTNIDLDHMSTYKNSYENLLENFFNFLNKRSIKNIYVCVDDKGCRDLLRNYDLSTREIVSYGFSEQADIKIFNYYIDENLTYFSISYKSHQFDFSTILPGKYNILNVTACIAICLDLGFDYMQIKKALMMVAGVNRRFDIYTKNIFGHSIQVIDDYGHHPTEIINCIEAVRTKYHNKKIIHIFQPHRYSRNKELFKYWIEALSLADSLVLLPTYSAGEQPIVGASSQDIAKNLSNCTLVKTFEQAIYELKKNIDNKSVILIQGAGDIADLVEMLDE